MSRLQFGMGSKFCSRCGIKIKTFDKKYKHEHTERCLKCIIVELSIIESSIY